MIVLSRSQHLAVCRWEESGVVRQSTFTSDALQLAEPPAGEALLREAPVPAQEPVVALMPQTVTDAPLQQTPAANHRTLLRLAPCQQLSYPGPRRVVGRQRPMQVTSDSAQSRGRSKRSIMLDVRRNTREGIEQALSSVQAGIGAAEQRYAQLDRIANRRCPGGLMTDDLLVALELNRAIRRLLLDRQERLIRRLSAC